MSTTVSGNLSLLRVHEVGGGYGPPNDHIDVEVVIQFVTRPTEAFGFQLRDDANDPVRRGMLDLLRDGFTYGHTVNIDYDVPAGARNGVIVRVWLTHPAHVVEPGGTQPGLSEP